VDRINTYGNGKREPNYHSVFRHNMQILRATQQVEAAKISFDVIPLLRGTEVRTIAGRISRLEEVTKRVQISMPETQNEDPLDGYNMNLKRPFNPPRFRLD